MLGVLSKKILNIISNEKQTEEEKEILLFGITRILEDIPKTLGIIMLGILLNIIKEILIVTVVVAIYKTFVGGVHLKTNLGCFFYSAIFYLLSIYSSKCIHLTGINQIGVFILIYIFAMYTIFVYVPADVPEMPKVNTSIRKKLKIKSIVMLNIIYILTIALINDLEIKRMIIYTVFYISVMTTRTIYKLLKNKYGYETYVPDELI